MAQTRRRRTHHELIGLVLIGIGVLLLLALLSFDAKDVPSWLFFAKYSSYSKISSNFIGRLGAILAGFIFFLLGGGSFFAAVAMIGLGIATFAGHFQSLGIRLGWALIFVFSWSFFLDFLDQMHWIQAAWKNDLAIPSAGGWLGHALGIALGKNTTGNVGSTILFGLMATISMTLATGLNPIRLLQQFLALLAKLFLSLFSITALFFRRTVTLAFTPQENDRLNDEITPLDRASKKNTKPNLKKKKQPQAAEEPELPLEQDSCSYPKPRHKTIPPPKIIDASLPLSERNRSDTKKKPPLEEVWPAPPQKTSQQSLTLSSENSLNNYRLPSLELLDIHQAEKKPTDPALLQSVQNNLLKTLAEFGIEAQAGDITKGPTITRYEVYPAHGVRVDRIANLEKDLARATCAERINILAPIPGKDTVGIEIANSDKAKVTIREIFESDAWQKNGASLPLALGKNVYGNPIIADLAKMPHLLVAGATGSGKSVCVNAIITSLVFRHTPETLRFIMIDPKVVEMQIYNKLPHLVTPVVTDPKKVLLALRWVIEEMEKRYKIFAKTGVRNITSFNNRPTTPSNNEDAKATEDSKSSSKNTSTPPSSSGEQTPTPPMAEKVSTEEPPTPSFSYKKEEEEIAIPDKMPFIVVIIDELADLMQTTASDVEAAIARITQMARAAGIHMIVATQTPRADVVTGIIKANIPTRIAFQVASKIDSRVILDENGAERLLGQGDMLYLPPGSAKLNRAQGVLVTDEEIGRLVDFLSEQSQPHFEPSIAERLSKDGPVEEDVTDAEEELVEKCLEIIRQEGKASTSMLQRRLRLGYTRAARVVDILEQRGILGPKDGARDREILVDLASF